ncbi:YeeE/YedE family protein [Lysobacter sp. A6]|uniref:YeeE/YedE family protein n=1 Tax=Noviluteimonas lactosilytica TaxID=2888523 RepID=A0ABS8JJM7_9GAMM|nr:YeeE/YedE family protein [Lysobacter lactosilyticus]MCC8363813.1 YeeE/YedE family protein [Lysobacter lactosilyticus]
MHPWLSALLGGVLIGLAATWLLWANGRIAGVSGIVDGIVRRSSWTEWGWRAAFVFGLVLAGGVAMHVVGQRALSPASWPVLVVAGLLVGYGTTLGGGCTSGHGVCGVGRLSKRSIVAVLVFMATAIATVFVVRHVLGAAA